VKCLSPQPSSCGRRPSLHRVAGEFRREVCHQLVAFLARERGSQQGGRESWQGVLGWAWFRQGHAGA